MDVAEEYQNRMAEVAEFCEGGYELACTAAEIGNLVIATNGLAHVQRKRIERAGLGDLAKLIWINEEVKMAKPDPLFFLEALNSLNAEKDHSIAIGDSSRLSSFLMNKNLEYVHPKAVWACGDTARWRSCRSWTSCSAPTASNTTPELRACSPGRPLD